MTTQTPSVDKVPVIALVGRPNVGKSTLFNRLVGERKAIVHDTPGVTRDRHYAMTDRFERELILIDTGGLEPERNTDLFRSMREQALAAIEEAAKAAGETIHKGKRLDS